MSRFSGISVAHRRNVGPEAACAVTARPSMGGFSRREVTGRRIVRPYGESRLEGQMRLLLVLVLLLTEAQAVPNAPPVRYVAGPITTFATHQQFDSYGFSWGPADGQFGAIPAKRRELHGSTAKRAVSKFACNRSPGGNEGVFAFGGTLDRETAGDGCRKLFSVRATGPRGWIFDQNLRGRRASRAVCRRRQERLADVDPWRDLVAESRQR